MKRRIAPFLLAAGLFLAACGQRVPPGEEQLQDTFTKEFLAQVTRHPVGSAWEQFFIDSVALDWQHANGNTAVSCCQVRMSSWQYCCEMEILLTHTRQTDGTWSLEGWETGEAVIRPAGEGN